MRTPKDAAIPAMRRPIRDPPRSWRQFDDGALRHQAPAAMARNFAWPAFTGILIVRTGITLDSSVPAHGPSPRQVQILHPPANVIASPLSSLVGAVQR